MIDHIVLNVADVQVSRAFYEAALAPLGLEVVMEFPSGVGFGENKKPEFWLGQRPPRHTDVHVAFRCVRREDVDAFHEAALAAGGQDNGPPGPRPQYHAAYYGAFVRDPDGNNIEACCHLPPS